MTLRSQPFASSTTIAPPASAAPGLSQSRAAALAAGGILAFALVLPKALQVWTTGVFLNPDDAMRAVEVRDFMAGQGWFDLVPHRLSPDHPFAMHWSRLVDLPLAAMTRLFGLALPLRAAELATRLVEPVLLFMASLWIVVAMVRRLIGPRAMLPAALLLAGSLEFVSNFIPGHIHHHAIQATLLLGATKLTLDALRPTAAWRPAVWAGIAAAVSLGIGLQSMPFIAGLACIVALAWIHGGNARTGALAGFGAGLAGAALCVFLLDVPPGHFLDGACDAFSAAHLLATAAGGSAFLLLALATPRLPRAGHRLAVASGAGLLTLGGVHALFPACLRDPMAGVDPLLQARWLADVGEALPLARYVALDPPAGAALVLTLLCGIGATGLAAWREDRRRQPWAALLLLVLIGCCGTAYQVRVAASTAAFMVPGVAWCVMRCFERLAARPNRPALLAAVVLGLFGCGAGWSALAAQLPRRSSAPTADARKEPRLNPAACFEPAAYSALAGLPPGLVLSTIDPGSAILAYTEHSVLAAPYHRNAFGNRVALLAFDATPEDALQLVRAARADYVVLCRASNEVTETAALRPNSLSAGLLAGEVPAWLSRIGTGAELILIYRVSATPGTPSSD